MIKNNKFYNNNIRMYTFLIPEGIFRYHQMLVKMILQRIYLLISQRHRILKIRSLNFHYTYRFFTKNININIIYIVYIEIISVKKKYRNIPFKNKQQKVPINYV